MANPARLEDVRAYPLMWPDERKRTLSYNRSGEKRWSGSFRTAMDDLEDELRKAQIFTWILSSDVPPHSRQTTPDDPGVAVWFNQRVRNQWVLSVLASDRFDQFWKNVKAVAMTLNRLRLIDDYGCYTVSQAIQGAAFLALPGPETPSARPWRAVLKVGEYEPSTMNDVEHAYKFLVRQVAQDQVKLTELNIARDEARKALGAQP